MLGRRLFSHLGAGVRTAPRPAVRLGDLRLLYSKCMAGQTQSLAVHFHPTHGEALAVPSNERQRMGECGCKSGKMYSSVKVVEVRKSRAGRMFKAHHSYCGCGRRRWMDQWGYWKCSAAILHLVREKTGIWICDTNI